jgi:hypothetical protein
MKDVAETLHLQKRGGVWHYYRRTPLHLVPVIGKQFFKKSLKTSDLTQARKLRTVEDLKVDALLSAAEQQGMTTVAPNASVDFGTPVRRRCRSASSPKSSWLRLKRSTSRTRSVRSSDVSTERRV